MMSRSLALALVLAFVLLANGCAPSSQQTPTPDSHPASANAAPAAPHEHSGTLDGAGHARTDTEQEHRLHSTTPAAPTGATLYVCPMHPEVTSKDPGQCPKCEMDLVPKPAPADAAALYICPMHPEVTSNEPGRCPKCHMALVPNKKEDSRE